MKRTRCLLLLLTMLIFTGNLAARIPIAHQSPPADIQIGHIQEIDTTLAAKTIVPSGLSVKPVKDTPHITIISLVRGLFGLGLLIFVAWIFSANRKAISWRIVFFGLGMQILLALGVLLVRPVQVIFELGGRFFVTVLDFSREGSNFLFGSLLDMDKFGSIFAFQVLPTIIFFSALTSLLFYLGIIQKIVHGLGWLLTGALKISGAEGLTVAGNIFLGQLEAPLMVKGYLDKMNRSEIMLVMVAGMATIAGGVMSVYIGFLGGNDPVQRLMFAKHLLAASVMAAPGAVMIAKILYPQSEPAEGKIQFEDRSFGDNMLDSIAKGTYQGLKMAASVAAMLLVFLAFIAMVNFIFIRIGTWTHLNDWVSTVTDGRFRNFNLQFLLGYLFSPVMWLIGVCPQDMALVGQLAGEKLVTNEFVGYISLASLKDAGAFFQDKSVIMATYMLCGFANFASVGMQIGGIGLLAPGRRRWLSEFGMRALLGGTLVSLLSAAIVGMMIG